MQKEIYEGIDIVKREFKKLEDLSDTALLENKISDLSSKSVVQGFWNDPKSAGAVMKELEGLKKELRNFEEMKKRINDFLEMSKVYGNDESFAGELIKESDEIINLIKAFNIKLQFDESIDAKDAIVTLHAGAGGTEACDWCEMLMRMYLRWCDRRKYSTKIIDIIQGDEAGLKSVTMEVKGMFAYGYLKSETGVHRLVRVSPFDSNKRRHTSFASADVIPAVDKDFEVEIKPDDLRIDTYRASGAGGQHVNKTDSAVRITHIPTGAIVQCQNERSQHQNKAKAMELLKARIYAMELDRKKEETQRHYDNKGQIGWGHQIRSYVFMPYQMVKDLRTGFEKSNIESVMDGNIDGFIEAYLTKEKLKDRPAQGEDRKK